MPLLVDSAQSVLPACDRPGPDENREEPTCELTVSPAEKSILDEALALQAKGFSVIPLLPEGKRPCIKWERYQKERPSEADIKQWFANFPDRNIGLVTGAIAGFVVLDVDKPGAFTREMPKTPTVKTSRGFHYYFKHPGFHVGNPKLEPYGDLKGDGGYVVAPPSIHESGKHYEWIVSPSEAPFADIPEWLMDKLYDGKSSPLKSEGGVPANYNLADVETTLYGKAWYADVEVLAQEVKGGRNHLLNIVACKAASLISGGQLNEREARGALMAACKANGLWDEDGPRRCLATINSGLRAGMKNPRGPEESEASVPERTTKGSELPTVRLDEIWNDDEIPSGAMTLVRKEFEAYGHRPSDAHYDGLHQIAKAIEAMAMRLHEIPDIVELWPELASSLYVSFLPCGMGKTTTLVNTVRHILTLRKYDHVGFIIFLSKLDEIKKLVERLGVDEDTFAVLTSDEECNKLGNPDKKKTRVLFTTQQMLESRAKGGRKFADLSDFHFNGKARQVRVWDEAILPARVLTLDRVNLASVPLSLRTLSAEMANAVLAFSDSLQDVKDGELVDVPDFSGHGVSLEEALSRGSETARNAVEALFGLQSRVSRVTKDQYGAAMLQYADILPDDIAPMLILDASGQQRQTYDFWFRDRKGIKFLPSPQKSFEGFTVHHWDEGAGKQNQAKGKYVEIAEGIARTIDRDIPPDKKVLVVHYKPGSHMPNLKQEILDRLQRGGAERVEFCNWGRHTATNDYSDFEYVILAGILQYNTAQYEATGLAAKGQDIKTPLTREEFEDIRLGEISHHILQAACRGQVRHAQGEGCPPGCHLYIIYSTQPPTGLPGKGLMERIFPGCSYEEWQPVASLRGKQQKALVERLLSSEEGARISKKVLMTSLKISSPSNLNRLLKAEHVNAYLKREKGRVLDVQEKDVAVLKDPLWSAF